MALDHATIWPYRDGEPGEFYYQRYGHPTGIEAERALGELDAGHALLFPSGAGATTAVALAFLSPGDTIALAEGAYYGTGVTFSALERWGLRHVEFDQTGAPPDDVQLVWLEAPSNPFLTMPDLEAAVAHRAPVTTGRAVTDGTVEISKQDLQELVDALRRARNGETNVRLSPMSGAMGDVAKVFNQLAERREAITNELKRVSRVIGREGRMTERAALRGAKGSWKDTVDSVNTIVEDLVRPTVEVARVLDAVAEGDLSQKMSLKIEGRPVRGEFLRIGTTVNAMLEQLSSFASEVTRVAREVGTEGVLGGQARVKGVSGIWRGLTESVNGMASNLTDQVRNIAEVTTAVAQGDLSRKITVDAKGEILRLKNTINTMVDQLSSFADEVTRVAREVGTEGKLGGDADVKGEIPELKNTINTMVDQLSSFADEVTRVAKEVGTEGRLGGQAEVPGV